jgi:hypothetical protein
MVKRGDETAFADVQANPAPPATGTGQQPTVGSGASDGCVLAELVAAHCKQPAQVDSDAAFIAASA